MRNIGFYRELPHGDPAGESIAERKGKGMPQFQEHLAAYLDSGFVIATTGSVVGDVLNPDRSNVGPLAIMTDGSFLWPAELGYYVREYNVAVPAELLSWAQRHSWRAPRISKEDELRVERYIVGGL